MPQAANAEEFVASIRTMKIHSLFYTPETKKEFEDWLANQAPLYPTMVVAMITLNYVTKQLHDMLPPLESFDVPAEAIEAGDPDGEDTGYSIA